MKFFPFLLFFCFFHFQFLAQTSVSSENLTVGKIDKLYSKELQEERVLNIFFPIGYDSTKTYPVIYVLDGSLNEDVVHIFGLAQFFPMYFEMPECIVIGIANVDRRRDYTFPTKNKELLEKNPTAGYSAKFIQFIENELKPYVNEKYSKSETSFLIGQSLGGLVATQILIEKPQLFSHYIIVSPSMWWDDSSLLKKIESSEFKSKLPDSTYVYISVGKNEPKFMVTGAKRLFKVIDSNKNVRCDFKLMKKDNHATILHGSVYQALLLLYKCKY